MARSLGPETAASPDTLPTGYRLFPRVLFAPPLAGRFRIDLDFVAAGIEVLRVRCRSQRPDLTWARDVFVDVAKPGALYHHLDRVALGVEPAEGGHRFRLELATDLEAELGETLIEIAFDPVDQWFREVRVGADGLVRVDGVRVLPADAPPPRVPMVAARREDEAIPDKRARGRRDAVLFAWWVPDTPVARQVGEYYLGLLRYHHPDSRIFLGVNRGSDPAMVEQVASSGLDVEICPVPPAIELNSDAAGFLAALGGFDRSQEPFDLVWFGHTKGASQQTYAFYLHLRYELERIFWARRAEAERAFADPRVGLLAARYTPPSTYPFPGPWRGWLDELDALQRVYRDRFPPLGLHALDTFFVLRGEIVRAFCDAVGPAFFRTDPQSYGGSRWLFEMAFPSIASMQGYEPFIDLDVRGAGDPRDDLILDADPKQNHRLALEEFRRWRDNPDAFRPRLLPWDRPIWQQPA